MEQRMEQEPLTVFERAVMFLYQTRLESIGIKAELRRARPGESENKLTVERESA